MNEPTRFVNKRRLKNRISNNKEEEIGKDPQLVACKSVDLDEIFQFSAARQRALERNAQKQYEPPIRGFIPNRVFINHVDSLNGKVLANYLSEQTVAISRQDLLQEDEENFAEESNFGSLPREDEEFPKNENGVYRQKIEIVGTVDFMKNQNFKKPEFISEILDEEKKEEFLAKLLTCGFIIYDITGTLSCHPKQIEEATWILNNIVSQLDDFQYHAPKLFMKYYECRTFILISTLMTWSKTKPIDPEDPTLPFTERDYRKRKPHPNYKVHHDFEKMVLEAGKKFPEHLRTVVIGSGITYGQEEDVLHFLFKMAWLNAPKLPVFKPGNNKIPLIHVNALADIVFQLMNNFPTSVKYIVAVEQSPTSLKRIIQLIAKKLGSGKTVIVDREEAFTFPEIKQRNYDMLTLNLNIIPMYVVNNMRLESSSELTFKENIDTVITEYKTSRNLLPIKIFIHGPPACGKSVLCKRLANHYKIHHLHAKEVIEAGIEDIKNQIREIKDRGKKENKEDEDIMEELENEDEEEDDDDDDDEGLSEDLETLTQLLNDIEESMEKNERHRLDEHFVLRLFKKRMLSNACQNQGFIIDGYPKTIEDTKLLYEPDETVYTEENDTEDDVSRFYNKKIMPEFVISLDASDEFLIEKVIRMPQEVVENGHYEEEEMCRRLFEFRAVNTEEKTPLIFYDELDVWPIIYNIHSENDDLELDFIFQDIVKRVGLPRNYDRNSYEEKHERQREKMNEKYLEQIKMKSKQIIQERREKMENWMFLKNQEKEMEEKALALMAMPLRHYLMKYIFPTLTRGLVEVARIRPSDPVDYLAEFLFKENPEGKMFQPNYDNLDEELASAMKERESTSDIQNRYMDVAKQYSVDESAMPDAVSNITDIKTKISITSEISSTKRTADSKQAFATSDKPVTDDISNGSCVCPSVHESTSTESSSTPPVLPSVCTCPPYNRHDSSESCTTSSDDSGKSSYEEQSASCRCPH